MQTFPNRSFRIGWNTQWRHQPRGEERAHSISTRVGSRCTNRHRRGARHQAKCRGIDLQNLSAGKNYRVFSAFRFLDELDSTLRLAGYTRNVDNHHRRCLIFFSSFPKMTAKLYFAFEVRDMVSIFNSIEKYNWYLIFQCKEWYGRNLLFRPCDKLRKRFNSNHLWKCWPLFARQFWPPPNWRNH